MIDQLWAGLTACSHRQRLSLACSRALLAAAFIMMATLVPVWTGIDEAGAQSVRPPAGAAESAAPPANVRPPSSRGAPTYQVTDPTAGKGAIYDSKMWKSIAGGDSGTVSIPDKNAGLLVQTQGWHWMLQRNGVMPTYYLYALGGIFALLALFFLIRGRIRIDKGWSGRTIVRFGLIERAGHWLLAGSFIILALTGLNLIYGKDLLIPLLGKPAFAQLSIFGKWAHNYVAFAFMAGLIITFVMWVWHNIPNRHDAVWLAKGGGMFGKGHPPAKKFNAGQKILFWLVMLTGVSVSLSGIALMFPMQTAMFAKTFAWLNQFGFSLPTALTAVEEMQYATTWHAIVAVAMMVVVIAHIYIGTIGMQGAIDAMTSGEVDANWAAEHHNLWAAEQEANVRDAGAPSGSAPTPAPAE
ncbi:MAG: formate dehydrogenase subunit gamma [Pseudomonadota bacterium]